MTSSLEKSLVFLAVALLGCSSGNRGSVPEPERPDEPSGHDSGAGSTAMDARVSRADRGVTNEGDGATADTGTTKDSSGAKDVAPSSADADLTPPSEACAVPFLRKVPVTDVKGLKSALAGAQPGDSIQLAPGTYAGKLTAAISGTAANPIIICGPKTAIIDGGAGGYTLHLTASFYVVAGISLRGGQKVLMLDGANDNLLTDLEISNSEQELVHFRMSSARNTLQRCDIHDSGKVDAGFGEGVYIGSAGGNDASDGNKILDNKIFKTTAECIDVKEGTKNGLISGNTLDGRGIEGDQFADSWIDVKGSNYIIEKNHGYAGGSIKDGFQTHDQGIADSGDNNTFRTNTAEGPAAGYVVNIAQSTSGNVVGCDNKLVGSWGGGRTNVVCK